MSESGRGCATVGVADRWWSLWIAAAALAVLFVAFGATGYAWLHVDSNYLTLPAVAWASGHGFVNPIFPAAATFDPQGLGRFLYHGPGFQIFLQPFLDPPTGAQAVLVIQWVNALNVVLFAWFLLRLARRRAWTQRPLLQLAAMAALLSFGAILMAAVGRPETLAITLVLVAAHLVFGDQVRTQYRVSQTLLVGAALGLLGVTHPLSGLEGGVVLAAWYGLHKTPAKALTDWARTAIVATVVALAFLTFVFPFPVGDWVAGMRAHAALWVSFVDLRFVRFFLLDGRHPGIGLTLAVAAVSASVWWWQNRTIMASPGLVAIAGVVLFLMAARISFFVAFRVYDSFPLFPLVAAALVVVIGVVRASWKRAGLVAVLALPGVGFVRLALLYVFYLSNGMSLVDARQAFAEILAEESGPVGVTRTLWLLSEDYERLRANFSLSNIDDRTGETLRVVVVQQQHYASVDSLPGYRMTRSYRREGIPRFAGLPLAWSMPGYQFDVYRRVQTSPDDVIGFLRDRRGQPQVARRPRYQPIRE